MTINRKTKQARKKSSIHTRQSAPNAFKEWCHTNNITQAIIHERTHYSYRTIHHLWNGGTKINKSTIHHLALTFKIDEAALTKMFIPVKSKK